MHPSSTPARTCALARRNRGLRARLHPKFAAALGTPHVSKPASHMLPIACPVRRHAPQPRAGLYLLQNRKEMTRSTVAESIPLSHQHVATPPTQRTPYDGSDHACRQCVAKPRAVFDCRCKFQSQKNWRPPRRRRGRSRPPQAPPGGALRRQASPDRRIRRWHRGPPAGPGVRKADGTLGTKSPPEAPPEAITAAAGAARRGFETPSQSRQAHPTVALRAAGRA